jgi:hypothetical protein
VNAAFASRRQVSGIADSRRRLGLSALGLWIGYFAVGGNGSLADVTDWLSGAAELSVRDYDLLVQAVNDEFTGLGLDHPVPYSAD